MTECGHPGHMKRNQKGTQWFAHNPGSKEGSCSTESDEHIDLKFQILTTCRDLGWEADIEVRRDSIVKNEESTWRADILATKNSRYVAFEIERSSITIDTLKARDQKYKTDNIEVYWFLAKIPPGLQQKTKYFQIDKKLTTDSIIGKYPHYRTGLVETENSTFINNNFYLYFYFEIIAISLDEIIKTDQKKVKKIIRTILDGNYKQHLDHKSAEAINLQRLYKKKQDRYFIELEKRELEIKKQIERQEQKNALLYGLIDPLETFNKIDSAEEQEKYRQSLLKSRILRNNEENRIKALIGDLFDPDLVFSEISYIQNQDRLEKEELETLKKRIKIIDYRRIDNPRFIGRCLIRGCGEKPSFYDSNRLFPFCSRHYAILKKMT